jgi:hypothetical protein
MQVQKLELMAQERVEKGMGGEQKPEKVSLSVD